MKNKGFTLSEILAVMVILSLLLIIAVPASQGIAKRVNEKLLDTKKSVAVSSAILWGQDNLLCFAEGSNCSKLTPSDVHCEEGYECKSITLNTLALEGYIHFDNEETKEIINPVDKTSMKQEEVIIMFHTKTKSVTAYMAP